MINLGWQTFNISSPASAYGFLGSVDANTGDTLLGWDTDQFNMDPKQTTLAMEVRDGGGDDWVAINSPL